MNDEFVGNALSRDYHEFERREQERSLVRAELDDVARRIGEAEARLADAGVFGSHGRLALARARVDVLSALREIDRQADEPDERALRARYRVLTGEGATA